MLLKNITEQFVRYMKRMHGQADPYYLKILIIGHTGSGKTVLMRKLAHYLGMIYRQVAIDYHQGIEKALLMNKTIRVDELQLLADARRSGSKPNIDFTHELSISRSELKSNVVSATQLVSQAEKRVKALADVIIIKRIALNQVKEIAELLENYFSAPQATDLSKFCLHLYQNEGLMITPQFYGILKNTE